MDQRRASIRLRTLLEGRVLLAGRLSPVECTVRDISDRGAGITLAHSVPLPPAFELQIPKKKLSRKVRVVWSNEKSHGLMFMEELDAGRPAGAPAGGRTAVPEAPEAPGILAAARARIAQHLGVPVDAVRLKAEMDR
jgi:hypothetical protein